MNPDNTARAVFSQSAPRDAREEAVDYRSIFEALPGLLLVLDPQLHIVAASDAYLAATMRERAAIVGRHVFDAFPDNPDDAEATGVANLRRSLDRVRRELRPDTMAVQKYDVERPAADGGGFEERYWSPMNAPIVDAQGRLAYIVHRVEDVTDYVQLQRDGTASAERSEQLSRRLEIAENDIISRSAELQSRNEELRIANRAKTDFLSRMSHELRTPLAAILGFSELLGYKDLGDDEHQMVGMINKAGTHLLDLINEVLELSRIELGQTSLSPEPVAVRPLLVAALDLMQPLGERTGITLLPPAVDSDVSYVMADQQRLKQVVINLLSNGIKYNRPGGTVTVSAERSGVHTRISVRDSGHGIAEADLGRLFVPFDRLGAEASGIEGVGLGLALSRDLVTAMGGTLSLTSAVGEGTTVTLQYPACEPAALEVPTSTDDRSLVSRRGYPAGRRLLYIEDTLANIRLMERILELRPSVVLLPSMQGQLGIDLAREHRPDLILLDLHLPDLDGDAVLARLRTDPATADIPVVILSADATGAQAERLLHLGARAYLTKPMTVHDVLDTLDRHLGPAAPVS